MSCCICQEEFDHSFHVPVIGLCGHSLCENCCSSDAIGPRHLKECPLCKTTDAFQNPRRNYQMLEMLRQLELTSEKNKKVQQLIDDHQLNEKRFLKCHECEGIVEESKSRVCEPCCTESGAIKMDGDGTATILSAERMNASILCADCFLEGPHKGHANIRVFTIKLLHEASRSLETLQIDADRKTATSFERNISEMSLPEEDFVQPLQVLKEKAQSDAIREKLEGIIKKHRNELDIIRCYATTQHRIAHSKMNSLQLECLTTRMDEMIYVMETASKSKTTSDSSSSVQLEDFFPHVDLDNVNSHFKSQQYHIQIHAQHE